MTQLSFQLAAADKRWQSMGFAILGACFRALCLGVPGFLQLLLGGTSLTAIASSRPLRKHLNDGMSMIVCNFLYNTTLSSTWNLGYDDVGSFGRQGHL